MSNLDRAIYRVTRCLRRRSAGEHSTPTSVVVMAFASEWRLNANEVAVLYQAAVEEERQNEVRRKA
jgi:hypothetical protein